MKTLGKLKLLTVSALLVLGMSSCLKTSDPDFQFGISPAYVLQTGTGDAAKFRPVMRLYAYEAFASATIKYTPANDKIDVQSYDFIKGANTAERWLGGLWSTPVSDSIPNGTFAITASNLEGKLASASVLVSLDKKLGEIKSEISYTAAKGVAAKWEKVDNASTYALLYKTKDMEDWALLNWAEGATSTSTSGTYNGNVEKGTEMKIAVGAYYGGSSYSLPLVKAGSAMSITWGTDSPVAEE